MSGKVQDHEGPVHGLLWVGDTVRGGNGGILCGLLRVI